MVSLRDKMLRIVASEIEALLAASVTRVGVDGAGKTFFADELAERIEVAPVIEQVDPFSVA